MTAFDEAWILTKMPYHGTTSDRLPLIMSEGLKPYSAEESRYAGEETTNNNYANQKRVFSTTDRDEALSFAILALANHKRKTDWKPGGKMRYNKNDPRPVVLHFPDELTEKPFTNDKWRVGENWRVSQETIPPEVIDMDFDGKVDLSDNPLWGAYYSRLKEKFKGDIHR